MSDPRSTRALHKARRLAGVNMASLGGGGSHSAADNPQVAQPAPATLLSPDAYRLEAAVAVAAHQLANLGQAAACLPGRA